MSGSGCCVRVQTVASLGSTAGRRTKRGRTKRGGHGSSSAIYSLRPAARRHVEVSLEEHLIEQTQPAVDVEVTTQTDEFAERPDTPDYVPKKTGIDMATQIEPDDLFSFDREVEPILDIIVDKTLEQALLEVEEETELDAIASRKVRHLAGRCCKARAMLTVCCVLLFSPPQENLLLGKKKESDRIQLMEAKAQEEYQHLQLVRKRARAAAQAQKQARAKVAALHAGAMLSRLALRSAMDAMIRDGGFSNPLQLDVSQNFMPWLLSRVERRLDTVEAANRCRDEVVAGAAALAARRIAEEEARRAAEEEARRAAEAAERRMYVRVFVKVLVGEGDEAEEVTAGPIRVKRSFTVSEVEAAIQQWLADNPIREDFELPEGGLNLMHGGSALDKERSLLDQALPDDAQLEMGKASSEEGEE